MAPCERTIPSRNGLAELKTTASSVWPALVSDAAGFLDWEMMSSAKKSSESSEGKASMYPE